MPGLTGLGNWVSVSSSRQNCPALEYEDEKPVLLTPVRVTRPLISIAMVEEEEQENCVTPKSQDSVLRPNLECPPAPRKPWLTKRKYGGNPPVRKFFIVPYDLELVFGTLEDQPKKKIRV